MLRKLTKNRNICHILRPDMGASIIIICTINKINNVS